MNKPSGLQNLGNTCYFNSALQMISRIGVNSSSIHSLDETLQAMQSGAVVAPVRLLGEFQSKYPHFSKGKQCDAHECLMNLLEDQSLLFRVEMISRVMCTNCDYTHPLEECYNGIQIKEGRYVPDLWTPVREELSGSVCEKCKSSNSLVSDTRAKALPGKYLIVLNTLKRERIRQMLHDYALCSVIFHSGSPRGGHYWAATEKGGHWWLLNDSSVYEISLDSLLEMKNSYVILYEMRNDFHR